MNNFTPFILYPIENFNIFWYNSYHWSISLQQCFRYNALIFSVIINSFDPEKTLPYLSHNYTPPLKIYEYCFFFWNPDWKYSQVVLYLCVLIVLYLENLCLKTKVGVSPHRLLNFNQSAIVILCLSLDIDWLKSFSLYP